jgi:hypothetical protein
MKKFLLFFLIAACGDNKADTKKVQLDAMYAKRSAIEKQVDSVKKLQNILEDKYRATGSTDTTLRGEILYQFHVLSGLERGKKKIDFSIDSLGKY